MPFQPVGDLLLTFPAALNVDGYRRELDLDTAVARVTYVSDGVRFVREVLSSPVDQVIAVRLTADRPGRINVTAGMSTPQDATIATEDGRTIVMRGVNAESQGIKGALTFEARVRVMAEGGAVSADKTSVAVAGADRVTLLLAAATSFKSFKDVSGDPQCADDVTTGWGRGEVVRRVAPGARRGAPAPVSPRHARSREQRGGQAADRRAHQGFHAGRRSAAGRALLSVRTLPAHLELASGLTAGESPGRLERSDEAALGKQVHDQHQHRDELLAG